MIALYFRPPRRVSLSFEIVRGLPFETRHRLESLYVRSVVFRKEGLYPTGQPPAAPFECMGTVVHAVYLLLPVNDVLCTYGLMDMECW